MILKWAGGKNKLYIKHQALFPTSFQTYIEPFLGGGSVFFNLSPQKALLADVNARLINLFNALKDDHERLFIAVDKLIHSHSEEQYYKIRELFNSSNAKPEYFLYLNRTCFNGVYRENIKGEFNVPVGKRESSFFPFTMPFNTLAWPACSLEALFKPLITFCSFTFFVILTFPFSECFR